MPSWHRLLAASVLALAVAPLRAEPLPDTKPLTREGDLAAQMVEGIDKYLMRELAASVKERQRYWKIDRLIKEKDYLEAMRPKRERLAKILGVVDERVKFSDIEYVGGPRTPHVVADCPTFRVLAVRWPVLPGVVGEGLLLEPKGEVKACLIAIPDADMTPEMLVGLAPGAPLEAAMRAITCGLASGGCRVIVPTLIDRKDDFSGNPRLSRMTNQPHREFVYRMAYEMGRHVIGYEVQRVLAAVDWFCRGKDHPPVGVYGYGEGGMLAWFAAALDERIATVAVNGWLGKRDIWKEPIYRNLWAYLHEFGDAEVGRLIWPRRMYLEVTEGPEVSGPPPARAGRGGAAPGALHKKDNWNSDEFNRVSAWCNFSFGPADAGWKTQMFYPQSGYGCEWRLEKELNIKVGDYAPLEAARKNFDPRPRQRRQFDQLVNFTQKLMRDSEQRRQETFWSKLDTSSPEKYQKSCEPFRKQLWEEVIGKLPAPTEPMNPRSRQIYDEPKWKGFEVTLDLYPDVFAYGILLLPKDLKPGERRPVVVCQHGLEGQPTDVCNPRERTKYYNSFGAQLADKGYIVYAPQNPYIGRDKFRVLQRKANPLGLSLFSFIVRQHERTLDWLATLPHVDTERMAFYGLSYGGKTAMRVPAILPRYCLSICSGDFNEWTWKNVSVDFRGSYMFSGEYEMPEFNMGHTLVYAEMAALIAPRPFMVERGHDDPVGIDEWVAYEYAKVRRLYSRLKIPERTEIEFFAGGHEIHGQGTFRFLQKHLHFPQ
jgi:dienelactone hydrolase